MIKKALCLTLSCLLMLAPPLLAQEGSPFLPDGSMHYQEDEGGDLWQQDRFVDPTGEVGVDSGGGEYIGSEEAKSLQEAARRAAGPNINIAAALENEKKYLPSNMGWGLGTGLLIGGWFALLDGKSARDNSRYVGLGIVLGSILGVAVGTKSVYKPLLNQRSQWLRAPKDPFAPDFTPSRRPVLARLSWSVKF